MNSGLIVIPLIFTLLAGGFWLWMAWEREALLAVGIYFYERLRCSFLLRQCV